jgi:hypothetical protein
MSWSIRRNLGAAPVASTAPADGEGIYGRFSSQAGTQARPTVHLQQPQGRRIVTDHPSLRHSLPP